MKSIDRSLKLSIVDNGQGIDWQKIINLAIKKKIIDQQQGQNLPLSKVKNLLFSLGMSSSSKITKNQGRGLGLNLVKQIVDKNHGKISVTSNKNLGTRFIVILPLNR